MSIIETLSRNACPTSEGELILASKVCPVVVTQTKGCEKVHPIRLRVRMVVAVTPLVCVHLNFASWILLRWYPHDFIIISLVMLSAAPINLIQAKIGKIVPGNNGSR